MLKIETRRSSSKNFNAIVIALNDKSLRFNGKATIRLEKPLKNPEDVEANLFDCFNDYVEGTFSTQRKIDLYKLYERAFKIVESGKSVDYVTELAALKPIWNQLFELIDVDKYSAFIQYSKYLIIPPDLSIAASKGDYPSETTITDVDYVNLVKLAFVTRVGYPIVFSLLHRFESTMGSDHAELQVGKLLKGCLRITQMAGWRKLYTYVHYAFEKKGVPSQIDEVSSAEYFTDKVLYNTIFNRLCCALIPETDPGKHLATAISGSVRQHEDGGSRLKKKDFGDNDDDDKRSMYERFQQAEMVKTANEVTQSEFFSFGLFDENEKPRYLNRFKYQCATLGIKHPELVEMVYDRLPPNWEYDLDDHVIKLMQLTFPEVVSPLIFIANDYTQTMAALALAQVSLSERGYKYLPTVLGMLNNPNGKRSLSDGLKLNTDDKEYLTSICDIQSRNNEGRSFNEAIVAATDFLDRLGNGIWQSNLEYGVLDSVDVYKRVAEGALFEVEIEVEIKNEFMALIKANQA